MSKSPILCARLLIALLALAAPASAQDSGPKSQAALESQIIIKVSPKVNARELIALPAPQVTPATDAVLARAAEEMHTVLWDDLRYSGVFDMVPADRYSRVGATSSEKVPYEEWVAVGASWLALLDISVVGGGTLVLEGRLFETKTNRKMVLGKRYQGALDARRKVAHTFADAIIAQVGGEPGVCNTQIAFVSDREGGRDREIFVMDYDGDSPRRVTGNRKLNLSPEWSPSNEEIVYTSYIRGNPDLYFMSRTGGANRVLFAKQGMNSSPSWSPDGSLIAFSSSFENGDSEIYTIRPDGTGLRRLTNQRGIDTNPSWSPTGRQIAFTSDRSGRPQIWLMDADGLNLRRVSTQGPFNDGAVWAPRGSSTRIAYAGMTGGSFHIFVYVFETDQLLQLTERGSNEAPSWSPDGRQIAFSSTYGGSTDIYVMNDDGTNLRRVTTGGNNYSPAWSNR